jgi:hypothetical protein
MSKSDGAELDTAHDTSMEPKSGVSHRAAEIGGRGIQVVALTIEMRAKVAAFKESLKGMNARQRNDELKKIKKGDPQLYAAIEVLRDGGQNELKARMASVRQMGEAAREVDVMIADELDVRADNVEKRVKRAIGQ